MKKILIAGARSYIGTAFAEYMSLFPAEYQTDTVDMEENAWENKDLSGYDSILFVAGIVHRKSKTPAELYYSVNRDLPIRMAQKAKRAGVKQFVYISTMSVYGRQEGIINKESEPSPKNHYGISKYQAEQGLRQLDCEDFGVYILRPPMVYGKDCKGNYQTLSKFVKKFKVFPDYANERSMIYIDHLCCFIKQITDMTLLPGIWLPQNQAYVSTVDMVRQIDKVNGILEK